MANDREKENEFNEQKGIHEGVSVSCTKLFLLLLFAPNNGWRKIKNAKVPPGMFEQQIFYPLLALAAVMQFLVLFYYPTTPIALILQDAIVSFVSLFASYFAVLTLSPLVLPPESSIKSKTNFFRVFVAASLSIFNVGYLLSITAPRLRIIFWLGVIYTLYVIFRGVKYLHVPESERTPTSLIVSILICGFPFLIYWIFTLLMPPL